MKRVSYSFNEHNQLVLRVPSESKPVVINGAIKVDSRNNLLYHLYKDDHWRREYKLPDTISLEGKWRLSQDHDLVLDVDKSRGLSGGRLTLRGQIIDCKKDYLLFTVKSKTNRDIERISLLKLRGRWGADKSNRIVFEVAKKGKPDIITFKGTWNVNKGQQIVYKYDKLSTKQKHKLLFRGFWDIRRRHRLGYRLEGYSTGAGNNDSYFDFRVDVGSPSIYPAQGKIKYRIGIGVKSRRQEKVVSLRGEWKFSRKAGLFFEIDYAGKVKRVKFSASVNLNKKDRIVFILEDKEGEPLGMSLTFRRRFLSKADFEHFLRLKSRDKKKEIRIGGKLRF